MVVHAVYENGVFRPIGPVELPDGRHVEVLIGAESAGTQPAGSPSELLLLEEINRGLSEAEWHRYHILIEKRQQESLSDTELSELTATSERIEALNVRRMECLAELARLRDATLPELMDQLGLSPPQVL